MFLLLVSRTPSCRAELEVMCPGCEGFEIEGFRVRGWGGRGGRGRAGRGGAGGGGETRSVPCRNLLHTPSAHRLKWASMHAAYKASNKQACFFSALCSG